MIVLCDSYVWWKLNCYNRDRCLWANFQPWSAQGFKMLLSHKIIVYNVSWLTCLLTRMMCGLRPATPSATVTSPVWTESSTTSQSGPPVRYTLTACHSLFVIFLQAVPFRPLCCKKQQVCSSWTFIHLPNYLPVKKLFSIFPHVLAVSCSLLQWTDFHGHVIIT